MIDALNFFKREVEYYAKLPNTNAKYAQKKIDKLNELIIAFNEMSLEIDYLKDQIENVQNKFQKLQKSVVENQSAEKMEIKIRKYELMAHGITPIDFNVRRTGNKAIDTDNQFKISEIISLGKKSDRLQVHKKQHIFENYLKAWGKSEAGQNYLKAEKIQNELLEGMLDSNPMNVKKLWPIFWKLQKIMDLYDFPGYTNSAADEWFEKHNEKL